MKKPLAAARREAQQLTLGEDSPQTVYKKIREVIGKDECILIGGPPCQAYSLVGRSRNFGDKDKDYSAADDYRNFLYLEYLKVISKFQPKVFVMENVKGMLSARVGSKLIFDSIWKDLRDPYKATRASPDTGRGKHRYRIFSFVPKTGFIDQIDSPEGYLDPHDFLIRAENHGIPQARHRVILLGIREDLANSMDVFKRLALSKSHTTVRQVISDLPKLRSKLSKEEDSTGAWRQAISDLGKQTLKQLAKDKHVTANVYDKFVQQLKYIQRSPALVGGDKGTNKKTTAFSKELPKYLVDWYRDRRMGTYVVNHETRGHIVGDLHRYLYYSTFAKYMGVSPNANNLPKALWPNHRNFNSGKFADRFRVQLSNSVGTTVTSHISKDGHYFIHYDPRQCRSLTVREAARIQTFPDNYYFVGNRTQQYVQVGNAVPPLLANKIAKVVHKLLEE